MSARRTAREAIATVALGLGELCPDVVFVGGAAAALFDDYEGADVRATDDVDCVVEVRTVAEYEHLAVRLRKRGFRECDDEGAPRCRWVYAGLRVDVMPTDGRVMGFTNVWYEELMQHASTSRVETSGKTVSVRVISPLYFVATKIEAFADRGKGDFFASHDMEDLVAVLAASISVRDEVASSKSEVCRAVRSRLRGWRQDDEFRDAALGHLAGNEHAYDRLMTWLSALPTD